MGPPTLPRAPRARRPPPLPALTPRPRQRQRPVSSSCRCAGAVDDRVRPAGRCRGGGVPAPSPRRAGGHLGTHHGSGLPTARGTVGGRPCSPPPTRPPLSASLPPPPTQTTRPNPPRPPPLLHVPMKRGSFEAKPPLPRAQQPKVFRRPRHHVRPQPQHDPPRGAPPNGHVQVHIDGLAVPHHRPLDALLLHQPRVAHRRRRAAAAVAGAVPAAAAAHVHAPHAGTGRRHGQGNGHEELTGEGLAAGPPPDGVRGGQAAAHGPCVPPRGDGRGSRGEGVEGFGQEGGRGRARKEGWRGEGGGRGGEARGGEGRRGEAREGEGRGRLVL